MTKPVYIYRANGR